MRLRVAMAFFGLIAASSALAQIPGVSLIARPFPVPPEHLTPCPFRFTIQNPDTPVHGTLTIAMPGSRLHFAVDQAAGRQASYEAAVAFTKRVNTSYDASREVDTAKGEVYAELKTDRGTITEDLVRPPFELGTLIGAVEIGGVTARLPSMIGDTDTTLPRIAPRDAPTIPRGFPFGCIFLEAGAEKMSDASFDAISRRVMSGAKVYIAGGADSPYLKDSRLQGLFKDKIIGATTFQPGASSQWLSFTQDGSKSPAVNALKLAPAAGSWSVKDHGLAIADERFVGVGRWVLLAFDPLSNEVKNASGGAAWIRGLINTSGNESVKAKLLKSPPAEAVDSQVAFNWLKVPVPDSKAIGAVLAIYFLFVVPINFWALSRIKRRELTWLTAPALSIVFSFVLYSRSAASGLVNDATSIQVRVTADQGSEPAAVSGGCEILSRDDRDISAPLVGVQDVAVDTSAGDPIEWTVGRTFDRVSFHAERLGVRSFSFSGNIPSEFAQIEADPSGAIMVRAKCRLQGAYLFARDGFYRIGDLKGGETRVLPPSSRTGEIKIEGVDFKNHVLPVINNSISGTTPDGKYWGPFRGVAEGKVILTALMPDLRVGPIFGQSHCSARLTYSAEDPR